MNQQLFDNIPYLAERLAHLHAIYHSPVFPLSEVAAKALLKRIKRLTDRLEEALRAEEENPS